LIDLQIFDMTYNVFSGTLNPTQSINRFAKFFHCCKEQ